MLHNIIISSKYDDIKQHSDVKVLANIQLITSSEIDPLKKEFVKLKLMPILKAMIVLASDCFFPVFKYNGIGIECPVFSQSVFILHGI
jgi:hypothetical protein